MSDQGTCPTLIIHSIIYSFSFMHTLIYIYTYILHAHLLHDAGLIMHDVVPASSHDSGATLGE